MNNEYLLFDLVIPLPRPQAHLLHKSLANNYNFNSNFSNVDLYFPQRTEIFSPVAH